MQTQGLVTEAQIQLQQTYPCFLLVGNIILQYSSFVRWLGNFSPGAEVVKSEQPMLYTSLGVVNNAQFYSQCHICDIKVFLSVNHNVNVRHE